MSLEFAGADTANSRLTLVTAGTSGAYGSYVELISSSSIACNRLTLDVTSAETVKCEFEIEVATGAAASETPLFSINFASSSNATQDCITVPVPEVSSGTRFAVRCRCTDDSRDVGVSIALEDDNSYGTAAAMELIGSSGGGGTAVDPGASANTKGSYVEISGSTSHDYDMMVVCIGSNANPTIGANNNFLIDVATGAAASETVLVEDMAYTHQGNEVGQKWHRIWAPIPSGSRVSARCQASDATDATDRVISIAILGINTTAPEGGGGGGSTETAHAYIC